VIRRTEWQVISIDGDGYVTLMDDKGNTRSDLSCPDETEKDATITSRLKELVEAGKEVFVTVLYAMKIEKIADVKESN
jgi:translation initiation factor 5A